MPRIAPGSAERTCARTSPELTCRALAPSARISAEECRESITVAHVVKRAFSTASVTSMIVMTASICSSRLTTGLESPPAVSADEPASLASAKAWKASTATMPVTVTAMFAALSSAPAGSASDQPQPEQRRDRQPVRYPDRAVPDASAGVRRRSARRRCCCARRGPRGRSVAASDTTIASPTTSATVLGESAGCPPRR